MARSGGGRVAGGSGRGGVVAAQILCHLGAYPQACDTLDGIRRWWAPPGDEWSAADVQCAVEQLVAAGQIVRVVGADGVERYARAG